MTDITAVSEFVFSIDDIDRLRHACVEQAKAVSHPDESADYWALVRRFDEARKGILLAHIRGEALVSHGFDRDATLPMAAVPEAERGNPRNEHETKDETFWGVVGR